MWSGWPLGALAWLMIHRLTGGAWGLQIARPLHLGTRLVAILVVGFALMALLQGDIYAWMTHPVPEGRGVFLDRVGFNLRGCAILLVWTWLAVLFGWRGGSVLAAALGLTLYGATVSVASADWFMSIDARRVDTSIGATVAIQQLLTALAVCMLYVAPQTRPRLVGDLAGLMIACLLGVLYLELMTFIIHWYGNLPQKVEWYVRRSGPWPVSMLALALAFAVAALCMLVACRQRRRFVQVAALLSLASVATHWMWLLVPDFAAAGAAFAACLAGIVATILVSVAVHPDLLDVAWQADPPQNSVAERAPPPPLQPLDARTLPRHETLHSPEAPDIAVRPVLATALGFCLFVAVSMGGLRLYFAAEAPRAITGLRPAPAATNLMIPERQAQGLKAQQQSAITAQGSDAGSLPIDEAMRIIAARGTQAYDPVSPALLPGAQQ